MNQNVHTLLNTLQFVPTLKYISGNGDEPVSSVDFDDPLLATGKGQFGEPKDVKAVARCMTDTG